MKLLEFLADLATDPQVMSAFRATPHAVLRARGLSETDQILLLSGDPVGLRAAVAAEAGNRRKWTAAAEPPPAPEKFPGPDQATRFPSLTMMEMFDPQQPGGPSEPQEPDDEPEALRSSASFPSLNMMEMFDPQQPGGPSEPQEPDDEPEVLRSSASFPSLNMMEMFDPQPGGPSEPQEPDDEPEGSTNAPGIVGAHEAESLHFEPIDLERDLAQDAVLAGISTRAAENDLAGVWSGKGLTVVGTGMRAGLHMTIETRLAIQKSAQVLYLVGDAVSEACIRKLNPAAQSLGHLYQAGKSRIEIYETIIARILGELETHGDVCVAVYGHPGVLTYPAWESIRRARAMGKRARMLPAISTEDSLFADLGIDIGRAGLQSFEATHFLYYNYNFDPCAGLLLWQISVLGEHNWNPPHTGVRPRLEVLTDYLKRFYAPEHEVYLYHAPEFPTSRPLVERVLLRDLPRAEFVSISTLYVPPAGRPERNEENIRALARATMRK